MILTKNYRSSKQVLLPNSVLAEGVSCGVLGLEMGFTTTMSQLLLCALVLASTKARGWTMGIYVQGHSSLRYHPVHHRTFSSLPGLHLPEARRTPYPRKGSPKQLPTLSSAPWGITSGLDNAVLIHWVIWNFIFSTYLPLRVTWERQCVVLKITKQSFY